MKRLLSGIFLILIVTVITLYSTPLWLTITVAFLILLALGEFNDIVFGKGERLGNAIALFAGALLPFVFFLKGPPAAFYIIIGAVFVFFLLRIITHPSLEGSIAWVSKRVLSILYIALLLSYMVLFGSSDNGRLWLLFAFTIIWSNDTFAYIAGRVFGRHKLSPQVSPNKTIEGAAGGIIGAVFSAWLFNGFLMMGFSPAELFFVVFFIGLVSIISDLTESLIKRDFNIKDSGAIIPGHGGVLDRIDSVLFSMPTFYYYLVWRGLI